MIIPQQETSGNYNREQVICGPLFIIPQQETSGNYNGKTQVPFLLSIIPQQETSGNYNNRGRQRRGKGIIPQQETSGNYNVLRPVLHYQGIIVLPSPFPLLCGVLAVTRLPPPVLFPPDIMNDTTDNSIFQLANHIKISVDCCAVYLLITIDKWGILLAYWRRCRYLRQVPRKGD